jgi:hypothetical protein
MADVFNVTASYDKAAYNQGDMMTLTISGGDVLTQQVTQQQQSGQVTLTLTAADGAVSTIVIPPAIINVTQTVSTPESVKITGVIDSSGKIWTISSTGLSVTATA